MSEVGRAPDWSKVRLWHRQSRDAYTENPYAYLEILLEQAEKDTERLENVPSRIEARTWLADVRRMKGNHNQAISIYTWLMNLSDQDQYRSSPTNSTEEKTLWFLAKAFIDAVEIAYFLLPEESVVGSPDEILKRGSKWLDAIQRSTWGAGLRLQKGLMLKDRGEIADARKEMEYALRLRQNDRDAPGYTLINHQLEYADILCNDAVADYVQALDLAKEVAKRVENNDQDRRWAYQIQARASQKLKETKTLDEGKLEALVFNEAVLKAQSLTYTIEGAGVSSNLLQMQGILRQEIGRVVEAIAAQRPDPIPPSHQAVYEMQQTDQWERLNKLVDDRVERISNLVSNQVAGQMEKLGEQMVRLGSTIASQALSQMGRSIEQQVSGSVAEGTAQQKGMAKNASDEQNKAARYIQCMVAMPFSEDNFPFQKVLLPALRYVLERDPYYWKVFLASQKIIEDIIEGNVVNLMDEADIYIAEITDQKPSVMMELGYMLWAKRQNKPVILLAQEGITIDVPDLEGRIRTRYPAPSPGTSEEHSIVWVAEVLEKKFQVDERIQRVNEDKKKEKKANYLSHTFLSTDVRLRDEDADKLKQSKFFEVIETIVAATGEVVCEEAKKVKLDASVAKSLRDNICEKWKGASNP